MKNSLVKKIVSISVISVVVALVVATIVLALVPKKLSNPLSYEYTSITIYRDGVEELYFNDEDATEEYAKKQAKVCREVKALYEKSLQDKLLSALLQGALRYDINVKAASVSNVINNEVDKQGVNALVFNYSETQLLELDGEIYRTSLVSGGATVSYNQVAMILSNNSDFEECTIYLIDSSTGKSLYQVNFLARQAELNKFVENIEFGIVA